MNDIMMTHYDKDAEAKCLYEAREAFKSIVGAIQGAGDLDKLGKAELVVLAKAVRGARGHARISLGDLDCTEVLMSARELLHEIARSRKGSIGTLDSHYIAQLRVVRIDRLANRIDGILKEVSNGDNNGD